MFEGGWNFGPTDIGNVNVQHLVELVLKAWGEGKWHIPNTQHSRVHEANFLKLDITKASSLLSWKPIYSLFQSVTDSIAWYRNHHDQGIDMQEFTLNQIADYTDRAGMQGLAWAKKGRSFEE